MGKRVHVAKRYEVEYGDTTGFNWNNEKFYDLLNQLGGEPVGVDGDYYPDNFESPVSDYDDAVENLKCYIENPKLFENSETITKYLNDLEMTAGELLEKMEAYRKEADTRDGYLHFASF